MSPTQGRSILTAFTGWLGLWAVTAQQETPTPHPPPSIASRSFEWHSETPFLGVVTTENPDTNTSGLVILQRIAEGPAAKAGLQKNDILLSMGDQILLLHEQLGLLIKRQSVGEKLEFTYLRPGIAEPQTAEVVLEAAPSPGDPKPLMMAKRTVRLRDNDHAISITTLQGQPFLTVISLPSREIEFQGNVTTTSIGTLDKAIQKKVGRVAKIEDKQWVFALPPLRPPQQLPPNTGPRGPAPSFGFPKAPPIKAPSE